MAVEPVPAHLRTITPHLVCTPCAEAIDAGAEEVFPLETQFYGDRGGRVRDPYGHTWGLAQHVEDVDDDEMARRMAAFYEDEGGLSHG